MCVGDAVAVTVGGHGPQLPFPFGAGLRIRGGRPKGAQPWHLLVEGALGERVGSLLDQGAAFIEGAPAVRVGGVGDLVDDAGDEADWFPGAGTPGSRCCRRLEAVLDHGCEILRPGERPRSDEVRQQARKIVAFGVRSTQLARERSERFGRDNVVDLFPGECGLFEEGDPAVVLHVFGDGVVFSGELRD